MSNSFTVNSYSPKDVVLTIGGYQLTGWQNITISRSVKSFITVRGIRGKHTRVASRDTSATISISLLQTMPGNEVLSTILSDDEEEGTARIALMLKDNSGNSVFSSNEAYLTGFPTTSYSGQFEYRNWELFCQSTGTYLIGGNSKAQSSLVDSFISAASSTISNIF